MATVLITGRLIDMERIQEEWRSEGNWDHFGTLRETLSFLPDGVFLLETRSPFADVESVYKIIGETEAGAWLHRNQYILPVQDEKGQK